MAGGRNVPDIGVQHPSNQNMMQMDNGGTKGVNLPNSPDVPQGIQNQAHPTQPGTAITQPSQPGQPYNNQPNQVNPNTQPNAPGSPQHTPLQNIKGTIYSANNPPSITDRTPPPPRRNPTNSQELDRQRQRGDWHENDDWDLELHDELGGHSGKHIYATWEETANRILRFGSANRIGNASSRFIDVASANRLAHETLKANSAKIEKWLRNPNAKKPVNLIYTPSTGEITGFTIPKGGKQFTAVNKVRIVLVKTGNNSYRIKTFYPYHK